MKDKNRNKEGRKETRAREGNGEKREEGRERPAQKENNQLQRISRNSHLLQQNMPSVWEQAPGGEGVSKLPQVSLEPGLDTCTPTHSSDLPSDLRQAEGRLRAAWQAGEEGGCKGKESVAASWPPAWLGDQQASWRVFVSACYQTRWPDGRRGFNAGKVLA